MNGIEATRGAVEYRLRDGDVEWWDYRDWGRVGQDVPVVVGAFPEPFLHGYDGKVRPAVVVGSGRGAKLLAKLVHGRVAVRAPGGANVLRLVGGPAALHRADACRAARSSSRLQAMQHGSRTILRCTATGIPCDEADCGG